MVLSLRTTGFLSGLCCLVYAVQSDTPMPLVWRAPFFIRWMRARFSRSRVRFACFELSLRSHCSERYPEGHFAHGPLSVAPLTALCFPREHCPPHASAPPWLAYRPAVQLVQSSNVLPPTAARDLPAGHSEHCSAEASEFESPKRPRGQSWHLLVCSSRKLPCGQRSPIGARLPCACAAAALLAIKRPKRAPTGAKFPVAASALPPPSASCDKSKSWILRSGCRAVPSARSQLRIPWISWAVAASLAENSIACSDPTVGCTAQPPRE
mmetsp:Transcript_70177/g.141353  ORF Transcript_70177/g.141353 Transcript_70177/m.141353 type:complete len:267 (+) Transcript_70177:231-1031(+)